MTHASPIDYCCICGIMCADLQRRWTQNATLQQVCSNHQTVDWPLFLVRCTCCNAVTANFNDTCLRCGKCAQLMAPQAPQNFEAARLQPATR